MSSILKVDTIQDQSGNNIINESSDTITIGASGDTVNVVGTLQNNGAAIPGDISSVVAGTGLSGGGTSGAVTLNVEAAQSGITSLGTITSFRSTGIDDNADALAITIDSSERVGINTASPQFPLEVNGVTLVNGNLVVTGGTDSADRRASITHDGSSMILKASGNSTNKNIIFEKSGDGSGDETMRINTSGNVGIQQTNPAYTVEIGDADSGRGMMFNLYSNVGQIKTRASSTDSQTHMNFEAGLASAGTIKTNNGSTSYNTSSDYRLKENVDYDWEATTRLKQLKPARFNWIADSDNTILDGFIAHEVTNIVPEAVSGEKDAIQVWLQGEELPEGVSVGDNKLDADGNTIPDYQGIDQSKLVPLLIKTIQELEARITTLEG